MKFKNNSPNSLTDTTNVSSETGSGHQKFFFLLALAVGALLAMGIHFFPTCEAVYILSPWIYLPCFLYAGRKVNSLKTIVIWLLFWCGSFLVRYWGILEALSQSASIAITLFAAVIYAIPFLIDRFTFDKGSWAVTLLVFPFASASLDYILEMLDIGSLFSLAPTQFDNKPIIQLCAVFGSKGIVFLLALSASLFVCFRKNRKPLLISLASILLLHGIGFARICVRTSEINDAQKVTIGWSAESITDDSFFADASDDEFDFNTTSLTKAFEEAKEAGTQFLCFPEESFFVLQENYDMFLEQAEQLAAKYQISLLLPIESFDVESEDGLSSNGYVIISSEGELLASYLKSRLIPFAEEPYYKSGDGILPSAALSIDGTDVNISCAICFDGDFSSYVRTLPDKVNLFFDISWDWPQVDDLHYRIVGLRAVENGLTVIKPTVNGYTTVTDYLGTVHSKTHSDDTGYSGINLLEIPLATTHTIYHRFGNVIDFFYFAGLAVLFILLLVIRGNEMESTNTKKPLTRFGEFEFLKALAILGLPMVHVMEEALEAGIASSSLTAFGYGIIGLCAFGPSVFMICMGFGIGGGKTSADAIRRTGIQFLLIGALLNIVRWLIPGIIETLTIHTPFIEDFVCCLQSDIYYFAGIYFVFYSFLKERNCTTSQLLLGSIIALTINSMLTPIMQKYVTNIIVSSILGNFIYIDGTSCFPLLSWMIFPTIGIIFGEVLKKNTDEFREVFMRRMLDFSLVFFCAFAFFLWNYDLDVTKILVSPSNDYITDLPNVLLLVSLACFLIGITYYLCKLIGHTKFMAFMLKLSAFIVPFYLLQWVIIAWLFYAAVIFGLPEGSFGFAGYLICVILITCTCIYVASEHGMKIMKVLIKYTYIKKKHKKAGKKNEK